MITYSTFQDNDCPEVSVIVPCYNHEKYLKDSLDSLFSQKDISLELLFCDDCSKDGSYSLLEQLLKDADIPVMLMKNEENRGVSFTLNQLLKETRGRLIKVIASDDMIAEGGIRKMADALKASPNDQVLITNGYRVREESRYGHVMKKDLIYREAPDLSGDLFLRIAENNFLFAPGAMYRREVFEKYGCFDESLRMEDFEFWLRLSRAKVGFVYLSEPLIYYRESGESLSSVENNPRLEQRRISAHLAEMASLEKHRDAAERTVYSKILLRRLAGEKRLAASRGMKELESILKKELKSVLKTPGVSQKSRLYYRLLFLKHDLKSMRHRRKPLREEGA